MQWIDLETEEWGCTCLWGSFYRWTKHNMKNGIKCKHIKEMEEWLEIKNEAD